MCHMMSSAWCCHGVDASSLGCPWDKRRSGCHDVVQVEGLLARIHEMNFPVWTGEVATWVFVVRENRPVNGSDHVKYDGIVFVEPWWLKLKPNEKKKDKKRRQNRRQQTTETRTNKTTNKPQQETDKRCASSRSNFAGMIQLLVPSFGFNWAGDASFFISSF